MRDLSELVQAAQSGDGEAYNVLIQRFQPMAYAMAYRYLRDHYQAQDIVQEAIIEAFVHLSQLKEPEAFPGWFRQIVFRQCTRILRRTTVPSISLETAGNELLVGCDPEDTAVQREVHAYVRSAVASLPQHERLVTVLFYGCCYSYNEVSAFLKIPLTTVKKRLHSARQRLKAQLKAALYEANENAPRSDEGAETEEIRLAGWWNRLLLWVQEAQGDNLMSDELYSTDELQTLAMQLGAGDWRTISEVENSLAQAGQAGIDAVLWGLSHPNLRVRRGCAGFLDHHGTDACFATLQQVALHDPAPSVRRVAIHAASCQRCKPCPLTEDLVGLLVQAALSDPNRRVRENAIGGLRYQPQDPRAVAVLEEILHTETDPRLRREAHHALKHQNPNYRTMVDVQARERGIAAARAEKAGTY